MQSKFELLAGNSSGTRQGLVKFNTALKYEIIIVEDNSEQMSAGQPPVFSEKISIEAQSLMMQPEAVNMLKYVNGFDLLSLYYFQMPFMMLPKDTAALEKSGQKLISTVGLGLFIGLFANVQIKRISMNFLRWPFYLRYPIRLGIMALPFIPFYSTIQQKGNEILGIVDNITNRKNRLIRTRDLQEYFQIQKPAPKTKPTKKK